MMFKNFNFYYISELQIKFIKRQLVPESLLWRVNGYKLPAPSRVKRETLIRYSIPDADWIETGTYFGETTRFLSKKFPESKIYTIEPAAKIYEFTKRKFDKFQNILSICGTSEEELEKCLRISNKHVNFWLDGHYSGDVTFKGITNSPLIRELELISNVLKSKERVTIFIDDYRLFIDYEENDYPKFEEIIEWSTRNEFNWRIEFDIIVLQRR